MTVDIGVTGDRSTNVEALVGYLALPEAIAEWSRTNLRGEAREDRRKVVRRAAEGTGSSKSCG
jgi:hypothetical protein